MNDFDSLIHVAVLNTFELISLVVFRTHNLCDGSLRLLHLPPHLSKLTVNE